MSAPINHDKRLIGDTLGSLRDDYAGRPGVQKARSLANNVGACACTMRLLEVRIPVGAVVNHDGVHLQGSRRECKDDYVG